MLNMSYNIQKFKRQLPIYKAKEEILEVVRSNETVIFVGETACGKTTQIPQYLLEAGIIGEKSMAITQPRRIAAVTIANRVSEELRTELGRTVGYNVRFENVTSSETKIKFLTDGMLLREARGDPLLSEYNVVMVDEAHERTLNIDVLLGIVKEAQQKRKKQKLLPLKVLVTSATLDYKKLTDYFNNAPAYFIRGRKFKIEVYNVKEEDKQEDYVWSALITVFQIHQREKEGDILVFATGQEEIEFMVAQVKKEACGLPKGSLKIDAHGLYSALPTDLQVGVFKRAPPGVRKVIFATNIAETSVTIPGIKYVVDTGMVKTRTYNSTCGLDILSVERISRAQADQRMGRAGRDTYGKCYQLYTAEEYKSLKDYAIPEILRSNLSTIILRIIAIGIENVRKFDFIDKPPDENIDAALRQLMLLEAITEENGICKLTKCGQKMEQFPLDPRFSKMIIKSVLYGCTDEILTIISLLSVENLFYYPAEMRGQFPEERKILESYEGDHFTLLNIYKAFKKAKGNAMWCEAHCVNLKSMRKVVSTRKQLSKLCEKNDIKPCNCNDNHYIRKCLTSGLFMNLAYRESVTKDNVKTYQTVEGKKLVKMHPTSSLFRRNTSPVMYTELVQTSEIYMRIVSYVDVLDIKSVAPAYFKEFNLQRLL